MRIALANLTFPTSPDASVRAATQAIQDAAEQGAALICFPECFVPGYRAAHGGPDAPSAEWLDDAHRAVRQAAGRADITLVLGTERVDGDSRLITTLVAGPDGSLLGWQDKVQLDPSEDHLFHPGQGRAVFTVGELCFGVVICHEGFRYPETVRAAVRQGAQLVLHPHYSWHEGGEWRPGGFAEAGNSFHEASGLCRAAENQCWFAPVNYASPDSPTTSALIDPDGRVEIWQPHGEPGLLMVDLDPARATRGLAMRLRPAEAD